MEDLASYERDLRYSGKCLRVSGRNVLSRANAKEGSRKGLTTAYSLHDNGSAFRPLVFVASCEPFPHLKPEIQ
jgi:hypothetical protein